MRRLTKKCYLFVGVCVAVFGSIYLFQNAGLTISIYSTREIDSPARDNSAHVCTCEHERKESIIINDTSKSDSRTNLESIPTKNSTSRVQKVPSGVAGQTKTESTHITADKPVPLKPLSIDTKPVQVHEAERQQSRRYRYFAFKKSNNTCPVVIQGSIPKSALREGYVVKNYPKAKIDPKTGFYKRSKVDHLNSSIVREEISEEMLAKIKGYLPKIWKTYLPFSPDFRNPCRVTPTGEAHCLPYFHVLSAAKSGSTDFWYSMELHPLVFTTRKEPHWWTRNKGHSLARYNFFFENIQECIKKGADPNIQNYVSGDGSTSTLWDNHLTRALTEARGSSQFLDFTIADVIRALTPNARLIFLLRNPIERLYSDYWYIYRGKSASDFDSKVRALLDQYYSCLKTADVRSCAYTYNHGNVGHSTLVGLYMVYVRDWLRRFPLDQVLFIRSDDWFQGQKPDILLKTYHFLGIDVTKEEMKDILTIDTLKITIGAENVLRSARWQKKRHPMLNSTRTLLQNFYAQSNKELAELTGNKGFLWED